MPVYEKLMVKLQLTFTGVLFVIAVPDDCTHLVSLTILTLTTPVPL